MSDRDWDVLWQERDGAYKNMFRVWKDNPETLRSFSADAASLVDSLRKHPIWEQVDSLRCTLGVTDRHDELPAPMDREELVKYAKATARCRRELLAEIGKMQMLASELGEVVEHARWASEKPVPADLA